MKKTVIFLFILSLSICAESKATDNNSDDNVIREKVSNATVVDGFKIDHFYKAKATFRNAKLDEDDGKKYIVHKGVKIRIRKIEILKNGENRFRFIVINEKSDKIESVKKDELYYFMSSDQAEMYFQEWSSIDHGTLIVPFKLRTKDGQVTGNSTLGYYIGYAWEFRDLRFVFPLISAGLTPISITSDSNNTDTKLGVTGAIGIVLKHADSFQVGLIGGVDHLGGEVGDNFEYEDDIWVSFMIGFSFANK